ncbi:MAG TPA: 3-deoxy-8-phosphooctulonate synthase [Kiritimatiellia bacterium]|nr:3-deoxy-8-phosphooctulonate synthase [Kiritimatiellia bacterium]HMP32992.1 3-deoxy-8-phosphooctulonate synthase [Kiritimatiellia bacterium]
MTTVVNMGGVKIGGKAPLALIAGPCVIESRKGCLDLARRLVELAAAEKIPLVFKASYDKANRSSVDGFRGPGLKAGLEVLAEVRATFQVPVLTDVHRAEDVPAVAAVVDVLQIPAFLCRQTDLLIAAGESGKVVNVKKGQFLAPWDMKHVIGKVLSTGNRSIILTERGSTFGYNNLVADMRSLLEMRELGYPVVFDATHSVQRPGGGGNYTAGDGKWAPYLARAAVAAGCDGVFIETHVYPAKALSDKENAVPFQKMRALWRQLRGIDDLVG